MVFEETRERKRLLLLFTFGCTDAPTSLLAAKERNRGQTKGRGEHFETMAEHKSIEFNNTGCELLGLGRVTEAHEMFRAAILSYMNFKKVAVPRTGGGWVAPDLENGADERRTGGIALAQEVESNRQDGVPAPPFEASVNEQTISILSPQMHRQGFLIHQADPSIVNSSAAAILVFNLGLAHHLMKRGTWKAKSFYELSYLMLALNPIFVNRIEDDPRKDQQLSLHEAIFNNLRICLAESGGLSMAVAEFVGTEPTSVEEE